MKNKIAIVGLGYVGLPLAVEFAKNFETIGFDISDKRIRELKLGEDSTLEVDFDKIQCATNLVFTSDVNDISDCSIYIVTVPTPINVHKRPDLTPLIKSSEMLGKHINNGDIVIYESTVYPGATEEICVPILEKQSGLKYISDINNIESNEGFYCGYSPERINPGDKVHNVTTIKKVTSGSTPEVAERIDDLYKSIITAGTYKASSIKVAEAAKVIENTQRDVNIALINELALIFKKLNIDTEEVLKAAETKWNFLPFRPGLVGGHCIGVDPYYLTHKAEEVGFHPEIILAGRRLNDSMGSYVAGQVIKLMTKERINVIDANILILGLTFKENCPDLRNTRVVELIEDFQELNCNVDVYDPWVDKEEAKQKYDISPVKTLKENNYDAIVLVVAHSEFKKMGIENIRKLGKNNHVFYDIKYVFSESEVDGRL